MRSLGPNLGWTSESRCKRLFGKRMAELRRADRSAGPQDFAISTCPKDGDVWILSDAGIARYSLSQNNWSYFTWAEGLPSNQANAIAFDAAGNAARSSQCDGIAMAKAVEKYAKWTVVSGPDRMPNTSYGNGLPTNLINCLLVTWKGTYLRRDHDWVGEERG